MKDWEARAQIALILKDKPLNLVFFAKMAKELWDFLNTHYEGKGEQKIMYLISDLFCGTLTDDSPLELQINVMRHIAVTLESLGHKLSDKLVVIAVILSLLPSYDTLKTILTSSGTSVLTFENVLSQVIQEEQ